MKSEVIVVFALALSCFAFPSNDYDNYDGPFPHEACKKPHEVYDDCGSACEKTCENWQPGTLGCVKMCVDGCFCEEGYVRSNATGECIPNSKCWAIVKSILHQFVNN
nr:uncharacterized protein LOC125491497 precursor [Aedes aegypti]